MIYIRTIAYNAAETLKRTVNSVLNQTCSDFRYFLCDNGSTDGGETRRIIGEYAGCDERIVSFYNEKNHVWDKNDELLYLPHQIDEDDCFCVLDADDEYLPTFFQEMTTFMEEHHLDIAVCGSAFISAADKNKLQGHRLLPQNLILQGNAFADYFTVYYQFMRTLWGKLLKGKTLRNTLIGPNAKGIPRAYGNDTFFTMRAFRDAQRVGILAKSLHKYYISAGSSSYVMHPERVKSDQILYEAALEYLKPYGSISRENGRFLKLVYLNAISDTLRVSLNARITPLENLHNIQEILKYNATKELLNTNYARDKELNDKLRDPVTNWLIAHKECWTQENGEMTADIILAMYGHLARMLSRGSLSGVMNKMPELIGALIKKDYNHVLRQLQERGKRHENDDPALVELEVAIYRASGKPADEIFRLLTDIKKNRPKSSTVVEADISIERILQNYSLLRKISPDLAVSICDTVYWIIRGDIVRANEEFLQISANIEIEDKDTEDYLLLAQNLSASAKDSAAFIFFKKIWIAYLIDRSRNEEARNELDEFEKLLPEDEDFRELRQRIT